METIEEEIVDSMVTDSDLTAPVNGNYMFSLDTTNGLTTTVDGNATYVTLPLHLLQDQTSLDGGHISVYLNNNQLTLLSGHTQTDLSTEQASEGDGQLILDTGEGTNTDELNAGVEVDVQGIDLSALEFSNLADGENILCIEDADGNLVQDRSADGSSYHFVDLGDCNPSYQAELNLLKPLKENQTNLTRRGPGRPKKDNADIIDPPIGKGPYKCEICNKEFPLWTQLKRHNKIHSNDKPHRCNQCSSSFNVESNLTLHMATHNTGDPRCPECHKAFARVASLKAHVMLHEKEESVFCSECGDEFTTVQQLERHKKEHLDEWVQSTRVHQCRQCQRQYTRASAYREHMKEHHRVKASLVHKYHKRNIDRSAFSHKCDACDKFFQKPSQLIRHKRIHTGERPYACLICSKTFNQKGSLHIHMCKHNGYKPFQCEFCPAAFSQKGNLRAHIARVHAIPNSGEEVYSCAECTCVFKKLGSLNSHMSRSHGSEEQLKNRNTNDDMSMTANVNAALAELAALEGEKSHQDAEDILQQALVNSGLGSNRKQSSATFQQVKKESQLKEEKNGLSTILLLSDIGLDGVMRRYNIGTRTVGKVRWLECSYCSKEFKKPSDIVRHIRVHTHERPYKCDRCFRSFAVKSTLTAHQRTHTGQKDHVCTICSKTFTSASSLKVHQRIHSDTKPFTCNICERKFRTSGHRRAHLIIAHKNRKPSRSVLKPASQRVEASDYVDVPLQEPIVITDNGTLVQVSKKAKNFLPGDTISLERPYKCLICSLAFRKSSHLIQHTRMHTGERPYQCMQCSKRFLTNGILKIHLRSHAGLRPYKCDECQRLFSTNGSLKRHMATHSSVRPFMCPYCHKTFKSSICTRKHMKTHVSELAQQKVTEEIADESLLEKNEGEMEKHFTAPDFTQAFSDQPFTVETTEEVGSDGTYSHHLQQDAQGGVTDCNGQNNPTVITHTLHADASGMITLPSQGHSTLTQENIREIERTLNEQIFGNNGAVDEAAEGQENDSDLESTTTEDLARTLASEPNEIGAPISAQILSNKVDPTGNIYESFGFDFSTITMQVGEGDDVDVMTMDENTLSANMAILLSGQTQEGSDMPTRKDPKEQDNSAEDDGTEMDSSMADNERPHVCVICQRGFKKSSHLKAHLMTHNKQVVHPCETCNKKFFSIKTLKSHQRTHCEKEFACHLCSARLTTNGSLIRHMAVHSSAKPFKCSICTEWFRTPVELRKHIGLHEPRETQGRVIAKEAAAEASPAPFPRFRKRSSIIRLTAEQTETLARQSAQEAVSVSEQVLIASAAEANRISELKDPDMQYSLEPLHPNQCKYCPKSFRKPSDLVRHVRIHTGERPYKCTCCNKCFTVKSTLDSHLKTHTGSKSFTCHVCGCVFSTKGSLKVHMRLHTGAKPFKCPLCEQKFRTSGHRKAHLMVHVKDASKKEVSSVLSQRLAARQPKRIKPPPPPLPPAEMQPPPAQDGGFEELAAYQTPAEAYNGAAADVTSFQLQITDSANVHISTGVEAAGNLLPSTQSLQIDEALLQQLQTSNIIFQTAGSDLGNGNVINMGEMNGNLRYEIHTDEHGQIINIQPMQDDGLVGNIMFNFGEELNIAVNEEQQETKPMKFRVVEGNNVGKSYVTVPAKKKKANEGDEDFTLYHECEVCGKQFVKPSQLERHKRIHTGERPFQCNLCEKAFTQKNSLTAHVKSHTGDKPHKCTLCSYSSTQRGNLKTHMRRAHQFSASFLLKNQKLGRSLPIVKDVSSELNIDSEVKSLDLDFVAELFPQIRHPNSFK